MPVINRTRLARSLATHVRLAYSILVGLAIAGCTNACTTTDAPERPNDVESPRDASSRRDAGVRSDGGDGPGTHAFARLAGAWHGRITTNEHGMIAANISVDRRGLVFATVIAQGTPVQVQAQITAWTGRRLRVVADQTEYDVQAERRGDVLHVQVPGHGIVPFFRTNQ